MRTGFYLMYSLQIFVERILHAESMDTLCAVCLDCCILRIFDDRRDDICDFLEVIFLESSGGQQDMGVWILVQNCFPIHMLFMNCHIRTHSSGSEIFCNILLQKCNLFFP